MTAGRLRDILPAAAALLDVPTAPDRLGLRDALGARRTVVLVLVDGLGADLLPLLSPDRAPWLCAARDDDARPRWRLHCGFPSTTPTSLVSLGTGAEPGEHGVVGFTVAVPGTDRLLTHVAWRDDPSPAAWQPMPTWFGRIAAAGRAAHVVLPSAFVGSGLTDAAYRGATVIGLGRDDDPAAALVQAAGNGGLAYGYTAALDTAAHRFGVDSAEWHDAAAAVDRYLTAVADGLPDDALLLVTADHGGLNLDRSQVVDVVDRPELVSGVRLVAGEPRARYLHVRPGAAADVAATWREVLGEVLGELPGDMADVRERDEAIAAGWFGTVAPAHRDRIGDVVAVCGGRAAVLATGHEPPTVAELIGLHGGFTEVETAVPLLTSDGSSRGSVRTAGQG